MTGGICNQEVTLESLTVLVSVRFRRELLFSFVSNLAISIRRWQLDRQDGTRVTQDYTRSESRRNIRSPACQYILNADNLIANKSLPRAFDDCHVWKHDKKFPPQHALTMSGEGAENCSRSILVFVTSWQIPPESHWQLLRGHTVTPHITPDTLFVSWLGVGWLPARRWICVPVPPCEHSRGLVWTRCALGQAVSVSGQLGPSAENLCDQLVSLTMEHLIVWVLEERFLPQNYILISHYWQYEVHPGNHSNNKIASHCTRQQQ